MRISPEARQFIYRALALGLLAASVFGFITMDEAANILDNAMLLVGSAGMVLADRNVSRGPRDLVPASHTVAGEAPLVPPAVPLAEVAVASVATSNAAADRRRSMARIANPAL